MPSSTICSSTLLMEQTNHGPLEPRLGSESDVDDQVNSGDEATSGGWFFEGAEKRLVIYFAKNDDNGNSADLRQIPREIWETALDLVNCRVLSVMSSEHITAYLLSESSMFLSADRVLIKTCGSTTLLHCLERMIMIGTEQAGFDRIDELQYSHKNLLMPEAQPQPYHSFDSEVDFLEGAFGQQKAAPSLQLGAKATQDRFNLYSLPTAGAAKIDSTNEHFKFEIIMEQLDASVMAHFLNNDKKDLTAADVTQKSSIGGLIPGMVIDDWLFQPCGYSMNGLMGEHYMTIHITPEADFSFVSLETDVPMESYGEFVQRVINCFKPGKFMVTLILPSGDGKSLKVQRHLAAAHFDGFVRILDGGDNNKFKNDSAVQLARVNAHSDLLFARYALAN